MLEVHLLLTAGPPQPCPHFLTRTKLTTTSHPPALAAVHPLLGLLLRRHVGVRRLAAPALAHQGAAAPRLAACCTLRCSACEKRRSKERSMVRHRHTDQEHRAVRDWLRAAWFVHCTQRFWQDGVVVMQRDGSQATPTWYGMAPKAQQGTLGHMAKQNHQKPRTQPHGSERA